MSRVDWFAELAAGSGARFLETGADLPEGGMETSTRQMALKLCEQFPKPRTCIGLWGENHLDYLQAFFAVLRAGHIAVPLNTRLTARELGAIVAETDISGLLVGRDFPMAHRAELPLIPVLAWGERELSRTADPAILLKRELREKDVVVMLCSSGSTGRVKIIPHTLRGLLDHAKAVSKHLRVTSKDRWLLCLPLFHIGGLAIPFRCLVSGSSLLISSASDADELNRMIDHESITLISVVPTVLERLLSRRITPLPKAVRAVIVGGAKVSPRLLEICPQAYATYGLTEAGSMVTCARPDCDDHERTTAGPLLPDTKIKIVNDKGKEVKTGELGEIWVRGPGESTSFITGGWLHTDDMGRLDARGCLQVEARRKDLVVTGGENVAPSEVEEVIRKHHRIAAVAVLPIEDPTWGQVPAALVVVTPGPPFSKESLLYYLEGKIARFKFPKKIVFVPSLPVLGNGKPDAEKIRQLIKKG